MFWLHPETTSSKHLHHGIQQDGENYQAFKSVTGVFSTNKDTSLSKHSNL